MSEPNLTNVTLPVERIKNALPASALHGPLVWLRDETEPSPKCSRYFAFQEGVIMSATLEFPFTRPGKATDPASCHDYGRTIPQAFNETTFATEKDSAR